MEKTMLTIKRFPDITFYPNAIPMAYLQFIPSNLLNNFLTESIISTEDNYIREQLKELRSKIRNNEFSTYQTITLFNIENVNLYDKQVNASINEFCYKTTIEIWKKLQNAFYEVLNEMEACWNISKKEEESFRAVAELLNNENIENITENLNNHLINNTIKSEITTILPQFIGTISLYIGQLEKFQEVETLQYNSADNNSEIGVCNA